MMAIALMLASLDDASAQAYRRHNRRAVRAVGSGDYDRAMKQFNLGVVKDTSNAFLLKYNMAYALHQDRRDPALDMAKDSLALRYLDEIADDIAGTEYEYDYHFSRGALAIDMEDWQSAVDEFKKCMVMDPEDMMAKENYIYAKEHLKNQQNQQNQQGDQDNKDDQQDQQQDQQGDQDNKGDQQDQQDQQGDQDQQQDSGSDQKNNAGGQDPKISQQAARQILQAMQAKEKETQEKVEKQKNAAVRTKQNGKNW